MTQKRTTVQDIREEFVKLFQTDKFVIDKNGGKVIEIVNANFVTTDDTIFGNVNTDYVKRELDWYLSQSLNVYDIPGGPPKIWQQVADSSGLINSNYGWCVFSRDNYNQYTNVLDELRASPDSRRAIMIYTRPNMWLDYNLDGRSDFMCTTSVHYLIRDDKLHAIVSMRSCDAWAGYRNDYFWQKYVLDKLSKDLGISSGDIHWNANSFHVYESQFYLVDYFAKTGLIHINKDDYAKYVSFTDKLYAKY